MDIPEVLKQPAAAEHVCPVFQPIFDRNMRVVTHEALMRVVDAQGVLQPVAQYVAQLEALDVVSFADIRMANQVSELLRHVQLPSVSLNASLQTLTRSLPAYLRAIEQVRNHGAQVIVEITETVPVIDIDRLRDCIAALRAHGFIVALDDAKEDHAYGQPDLLNVFAPDIVKIDGQFFHEALADRDKHFHLEHIVDTVHAFGGTVVFEWIDTRERLERALALEADWVQGFLLGRPKSLWPSSMCRNGARCRCGHAHCPIAADSA